jgi:type IV pilus assembly protein PilV
VIYRSVGSRGERGFLMIEVLITMFVLLIGLIGLAGLQARAQQVENESYQRVQALMLLRDMADRINANRALAASYVTGSPLGTGSSISCTAPTTTLEIDQCEWHTALLGAAETSGGANVGAMLNARGCVSNLTASPNGPYLVQVVWQGLVPSGAPPASVTCGSGSYGDESLRRAVTTVVQIGDLT